MRFLYVILMGSSRAHGPSAGPAEANGLPEAHGPRGHCTPLSVALPITIAFLNFSSLGLSA